jgi:transketolase
VILSASGSEVALALEARERLGEEGVAARVVSMPSWVLFERQPQEYQDEVLPPDVHARVAVEAASPHGWHRWVGSRGRIVGIGRFGESAPATAVFEQLGLTAANVADQALAAVGRDTAGAKQGGYATAGPARHGVDE